MIATPVEEPAVEIEDEVVPETVTAPTSQGDYVRAANSLPREVKAWLYANDRIRIAPHVPGTP